MLLAQRTPREPTYADCTKAKILDVNTCYQIKSRKGFGRLQEFKSKKKDEIYYFAREHHSHWFEFVAPHEGILTFELTPDNSNDDYDWLLYKADDPFYCACIKTKQELPVRGNISRNDRLLLSRTGMAMEYTNEFAPSGPGNSFSKPIEVEKGDRFYLVVDDNYIKGKGFELEVSLPKPKAKANDKTIKLKKLKVSGIVTDAVTMLPVKAKITVEQDTTGKVVATVFSDSLTGEYSVNLFVRKYVFTVEGQGFMPKSESVNYRKVTATEVSQNFSLDSIRVGVRANFYNIRFQPNKSLIKPTSEPELYRLYGFLKNYPGIYIDIKGHTNTNKLADQYFLQRLSYRRAEAIRDFLTQKGIDAKRITYRGLGGKEPLIVTDDFEKAQINSRVEVVITNILN